jgi:hypothetical protein
VRVASWVFVLCAVVVALGIFLPALALRPGGAAISKRTELSLHTISRDRHTMRRLLAAYHASSRRELGGRVIRSVVPKITGKPRAALEDARDAMDTLDDLSDDDVRTAGTALTVTLWSLIGLEAILIALVFGELMRGTFRRWRLGLALLGAVLAAATAIALHLVCREAAWQANDEVGRTIVTLGPGAYLLPAGGVGALIAAVVLVARQRSPGRAKRGRG